MNSKLNGVLVQTTLYGKEILDKIVATRILGNTTLPKAFQLPSFEYVPMTFCSYICKGYTEVYSDGPGVLFETDSPVVYASPVDSWHFLREGKWLSGHERFIFSSIEDMLEKYPTQVEFKKDFRRYFKQLRPEEIYPQHEIRSAESRQEMDYCLRPEWISSKVMSCNEITFKKPLKIKNPLIFNSRDDLKKYLAD